MNLYDGTHLVLASYDPEYVKRIKYFERMLETSFSEPRLLIEALTHSSAASEMNRKNPGTHMPWNERLEFLGDSVLSLVLSSHLIKDSAGFNEGELSKIRASLVSEESLAGIAKEMRLGEHLILSYGEIKSGGRSKVSVLADGLEAVFGAIMLDKGYEHTEQVILKLYAQKLKQPLAQLIQKDYKSALQEKLQKRFKARPTYLVTSSDGPEHSLSFRVSVCFKGLTLGKGIGPTKKRASQNAALHALDTLTESLKSLEAEQCTSEGYDD